MKNCDVVIIGAGIVGLSIAWQLRRRSSLRIAVCERGPGIGAGSTGASSAVCRYRYSADEMVRLARDGIHAYQEWNSYLGEHNPRARFQRDGVLWMPGADEKWAEIEHPRLAGLGVRSDILADQDLLERFPALNPCPVCPDLVTAAPHDCGAGHRHLLEIDGGWMDPVSAAQDTADALRRAGVTLSYNAEVKKIRSSGGRVTGVVFSNGEEISTDLVINAAGPWCNSVYRAAGLDAPMQMNPVRIQVVHLDRPTGLDGHLPVTVDMAAGIYLRTQNRGQQLLVSSVREEDEREVVDDPDDFLTVADDLFRAEKLHLLEHRLRGLAPGGNIRDYCGLYTINQIDVHPVVGPWALPGFWVANGFSGHGFKLAPAIGSLVARAISGESSDFDSDLDLDYLSPDRAPLDSDSRSVLA